jgi:methyl-accepting chemotaxis protein
MGREKIEIGKQTAEDCGRSLEQISKAVAEVDSMITEISAASSEQAQGVEEINKAMNMLDQAVLTNTVSAQTSAQTADGLRNQSQTLSLAVNQLQALVNGESLKSVSGGPEAGPELESTREADESLRKSA